MGGGGNKTSNSGAAHEMKVHYSLSHKSSALLLKHYNYRKHPGVHFCTDAGPEG